MYENLSSGNIMQTLGCVRLKVMMDMPYTCCTVTVVMIYCLRTDAVSCASREDRNLLRTEMSTEEINRPEKCAV